MFITWILIFTLMGVCVQNYTGFLPSKIESEGNHFKRKTERKPKLNIAIPSTMVLNKKMQEKAILHSQPVPIEKPAEVESKRNNWGKASFDKVLFPSSTGITEVSYRGIATYLKPNVNTLYKIFKRATLGNSNYTNQSILANRFTKAGTESLNAQSHSILELNHTDVPHIGKDQEYKQNMSIHTDKFQLINGKS